jgi:hypothetical protein
MSEHTKGCKYEGKEWTAIGEGCCAPEAHAWWIFQRYMRLQYAACRVVTDRAQDTLEDPVGSAERMPYCRIHSNAIDQLAVAAGLRSPSPRIPGRSRGQSRESGGRGKRTYQDGLNAVSQARYERDQARKRAVTSETRAAALAEALRAVVYKNGRCVYCGSEIGYPHRSDPPSICGIAAVLAPPEAP